MTDADLAQRRRTAFLAHSANIEDYNVDLLDKLDFGQELLSAQRGMTFEHVGEAKGVFTRMTEFLLADAAKSVPHTEEITPTTALWRAVYVGEKNDAGQLELTAVFLHVETRTRKRWIGKETTDYDGALLMVKGSVDADKFDSVFGVNKNE